MEMVLTVLWFFLPVGIANSLPIPVAKIPLLKTFAYPLDFFLKFRKKRVFGDHKTFRGLFAGIIGAVVIILFQQFLYERFDVIQHISPIDYSTINPFTFGLLCATGALFGDAVESFFKRQIGISPGKPWFPFDQIDYIIGGVVTTYWYAPLSFTTYIVLILVWFGMHLLFTWIGYIRTERKSDIARVDCVFFEHLL